MRKLRLYLSSLCLTAALTSQAQVTPVSQMEYLDRGVVALLDASAMGNFVSWRFLGTDDKNTRFDLIRNGEVIASDLTVTNYDDWDWDYDPSNPYEYQVVTKVNGQVIDTSAPVTPWPGVYKQLKLDRPAGGTTESGAYTYTPNDCSVGDVDGDGQYEIFVKWDPSNSKDNSQDGYTGNVIIDCYKLDGTKLWRIDLGRNIRAGAHYTQFMVYDFDGDGKAEMICKTAPGSKDGAGEYVNQAATLDAIKAADNTKVWLSTSGRMDGGHEYLTVFDGQTGKAIHTIAYLPNRNATSTLSEAAGTFNWYDSNSKNDTHGYNRGDRYLAAVAYLDGPDKNPSGVFCRGYYTLAFLFAVDFDGQQLHPRWLSSHRTKSSYILATYDANGNSTVQNFTGLTPTSGSGSGTMYSNGNHNLSVGDVDGDGKDEIIWGSAALDNDGKLLYGTGFGHGDAIHLGKLDPDRDGLQVFQVHEEKGTYSWDVHDAWTGEILLKGGPSGVDNGRGVAADIVASNRGYEFWSAYGGMKVYENGADVTTRVQGPFSVQTGEQVGTNTPSMNFRIYWDGDLQDELLDGTNITKYAPTGKIETLGIGANSLGNLGSPASNNSTKSTPCLSADIFGDWREEVILRSTTDDATLNIYTTVTPTEYRVPTLMHDHVYRMGICWQNVAYNQPPHLGYYLPDYIDGKLDTGISNVRTGVQPQQQSKAYYDLSGRQQTTPQKGLNIVRQNGKVRKVVIR